MVVHEVWQVQLLEHLLPHVCGQILETDQVHWPNEAFSSPILVDTFRIDSLEVLGISSELLATAHPEEVRVLGVSIEAEVLHLAPLLLVLNGEKSVVLELSLECGNRKLFSQDLAAVQPPPVPILILAEQVVDLLMIHGRSLVEVVQQPFFCLRFVALQELGDASFCFLSHLRGATRSRRTHPQVPGVLQTASKRKADGSIVDLCICRMQEHLPYCQR